MDTKFWYVFSKEELESLLQDQRELCAEVVGLSDFDPEAVMNAASPELPKALDEWMIVNKITSKQK